MGGHFLDSLAPPWLRSPKRAEVFPVCLGPRTSVVGRPGMQAIWRRASFSTLASDGVYPNRRDVRAELLKRGALTAPKSDPASCLR